MMPNDLWSGPAEPVLDMGETIKANMFLRSENGRFVAILKDNLELEVIMKTAKGDNLSIWKSD